jgi:hypothetical protein
MTDKQSEALRLADALSKLWGQWDRDDPYRKDIGDAADELVRLHAQLEKKSDAIQWALDYIRPESDTNCECPLCKADADLRAAIEQAEQQEPVARKQPVSNADELPAQEPVAWLWQHSETGRTRIVMPAQIVTTDATWFVVGPLYLGAAPPHRRSKGAIMTRDDIIRMAREAGSYLEPVTEADRLALERFFHAAQAAEREANAKLCEEMFSYGALYVAAAIRAKEQS